MSNFLAGLGLNGKQMKKVILFLEKLKALFAGNHEALEVLDFILASKNLYDLSVSKTLASNWEEIHTDFVRRYQSLVSKDFLSLTQKGHICCDHIPWYFERDLTLKLGDTSGAESLHGTLKNHMKKCNKEVSMTIGQDSQVSRLLSGTVRYKKA